MHPQLELLLEIQDLRSQRTDMDDGVLGDVESDVFDVRLDEARELLDATVSALELRLDDDVRNRYRSVSSKGPRTVAPVIRGICYGCFMAVATARASVADRNSRVECCEHCGRFLYHVD